MKTRRQIGILFLLATVLFVSMLSGCGESSSGKNNITSVYQFTTERVGVQAGTVYEENLLEMCPDVEIAYYTYPTDMVVALEQGKLDFFDRGHYLPAGKNISPG